MKYKEICEQMESSGWLSHVVAASNTNYGRGNGPRLDVALRRTQTFQAFISGQPAPEFDDSQAAPATLHYNDEHGPHAEPVLVDSTAGLILCVHPDSGKRLVGFLSDFPGDHLRFASTPIPPKPTTPVQKTIPPTPIASDIEGSAPERVATTVYRILRDTELARRVKHLHNFECQICGHTLILPDGSRYAEAHHIRPLGQPHNGPDTHENILCLCPNHHAALDYRALPIDSATISNVSEHRLSAEHIDYHNCLISNDCKT